MRRGLGLMLLLGALLAPVAAHAQITVSRSPAAAPTLGSTVRGTTTTVFSVSTTGAVTRTSGDALRLSTGSVTAPTITISCNLSNCGSRRIRVTIAPAGQTADASLIRFRVSNLSGATYQSGSAPAEAQSMTFDLNPPGYFATVTFRLGMDVQLAVGSTRGLESFNYTVTATLQ